MKFAASVPASDRDPDDPCYRIKSIAEKYERVAPRKRTHALDRRFRLKPKSFGGPVIDRGNAGAPERHNRRARVVVARHSLFT